MRRSRSLARCFSDRSEKGFLAEEGCPFHCSADADSHDDGWAGVSASVENGVDDKLLDSFHACTGRKHLESALVFAAEPLWCYGDVELISRYDFVVNDGWCVVCCVHTVYRVFHNRLAQIAVCIALSHALVDGFLDETARNVAILPHSDEHNRHSRVLTHRHTLGSGDVGILYYRTDDFACQGRFLLFLAYCELVVYIVGKHVTCFYTEFFYQLRNS